MVLASAWEFASFEITQGWLRSHHFGFKLLTKKVELARSKNLLLRQFAPVSTSNVCKCEMDDSCLWSV